MDVKVTVEMDGIWISHRFEQGKPAPEVTDIEESHKGHTLYVVTDKPARDKVKSAKGLTTDLEVLDAIKDDVLENVEFVRWL